LDVKATVFIEYAPLETAWVPVTGENYFYIYCLWVLGDQKGKGYGKALMEGSLCPLPEAKTFYSHRQSRWCYALKRYKKHRSRFRPRCFFLMPENPSKDAFSRHLR